MYTAPCGRPDEGTKGRVHITAFAGNSEHTTLCRLNRSVMTQGTTNVIHTKKHLIRKHQLYISIMATAMTVWGCCITEAAS